MLRNLILFLSIALVLAGCGGLPTGSSPARTGYRTVPHQPPGEKAQEVVLYALGLLDTGYRSGAKTPEGGWDCSGMASYIYRQAAGLRVEGSAADIARRGHEIPRDSLRPGDLVFFNTLNRPYSHVGIYIGDNRFVHAPNSNGKIRIDSLGSRYFADRFEAARSYLD